MFILVQKEPERKIALVSDSYAVIFKSVTSQKDSSRPLCAIELLPKAELRNYSFQKMTSHEIHGFIGLIELDGLIFICTITGKSKVAQPIPGETVNKIFAVDFFCLNDPQWDFVDIDSNGYPILPEDEYQSSQNQGLPKHPCHELRKLLSNAFCFQYSNFSGLTYSITFMCRLVGLMYWPKVTTSQLISRKSFNVCRTCSSVSPKPNIRDVLVINVGTVSFAFFKTLKDCL